jgi:hypothetical protein
MTWQDESPVRHAVPHGARNRRGRQTGNAYRFLGGFSYRPVRQQVTLPGRAYTLLYQIE